MDEAKKMDLYERAWDGICTLQEVIDMLVKEMPISEEEKTAILCRNLQVGGIHYCDIQGFDAMDDKKSFLFLRQRILSLLHEIDPLLDKVK